MSDFHLDDPPNTDGSAGQFGEVGPAPAPHPNGNGRSRAGVGGAFSPAALPLFQFFAGVNWRNQPPVAPAPTEPLGALTVSGFLASVNWRNVAAPSTLPGSDDDAPLVLPPTIDMVLDEFVWE